MDAIHSEIRTFLGKHFRAELAVEDDIFALGFVNSLFAMQLVQFIEGQFGVEVESDDLELDNFRSIGAMGRFIARKRGE
ncbi:MAG: acyl carrier protein [Nannocystaceae bacterium]